MSEVAGTVKCKVLTWNTLTVSADSVAFCSVYSVLREFLLDQVSWAGAMEGLLSHSQHAVIPHHVLGIICLE